jgi:tRNA-splicing ligase RtcB (3'-phosphate/5'-hydroxy nucleic acid ligase)
MNSPSDLGSALDVSSAGAIRGVASPQDKLIRLSLGDETPGPILEVLERMALLPFVESVLALPDVHWKEQMEVPSSISVTTRDMVVPEFTSMAVNDGMGVVKTGLKVDEMSPERLEAFFTRVNSHAAANFYDTNRYSISPDDLRRVLYEGARGLLARYGMDESMLDRIEDGGRYPSIHLGNGNLTELVPIQMLTKFSRSEMGLNFGGNHFLEVQAVDEVLDEDVARRWGFERGQVVVMYHLGPGPLGGTLLNHYSRRTKLQRSRVPLFFLSKLLFHYVQRMGRGAVGKKWGIHFRQNEWTPLPAQSEEGVLIRRAMAMAINYGYGYRLGTIRAIWDGLHEAISPTLPGELFCDITHNGAAEAGSEEGFSWTARHNACPLEPGKPTIVAGSCDVHSYLGIGGGGISPRLNSYDHGAGNLIEHYRESGRLVEMKDGVMRFRMTRGPRGTLTSRKEIPLRTSEPIDRLMQCFAEHGMMRPVLKLRPLGNLKN